MMRGFDDRLRRGTIASLRRDGPDLVLGIEGARHGRATFRGEIVFKTVAGVDGTDERNPLADPELAPGYVVDGLKLGAGGADLFVDAAADGRDAAPARFSIRCSSVESEVRQDWRDRAFRWLRRL